MPFPTTPVLTEDPHFTSGTDLTSYATGSITPVADTPYIIFVYQSHSGNSPNIPIISDAWGGVTWTQEHTEFVASNNNRLTAYSGVTGSSPSAGAITASFGAQTQQRCTILVIKCTGANPADIVRQTKGGNNAGASTLLDLVFDAALGTDTLTLGFFIMSATGRTWTARQSHTLFNAGVEFESTDSVAEYNTAPSGTTVGVSISGGNQTIRGITLEINPLSGATLSWTTQPSSEQEDVAISPAPVVTSSDAGFTGNVTLSSDTANLSGTLTVAAVGGVATFSNVIVGNPGTHTLLAAATGYSNVESASFSVTPAPAVALTFGQQPSNTVVSTSIAPAVTVRAIDSEGDTDTNYVTNITLVLQAGTGTLGGTVTKTPVNGVATFDNLTINTAGTGKVLRASSGALTVADSNAFTITATGPTTSRRAMGYHRYLPLLALSRGR